MKIIFFLGGTPYSSGLYNATIDVAKEISASEDEVSYWFYEDPGDLKDNDRIIDVWGLSRSRFTSRIFIKLMKLIFGYHFYYLLASRLFSAQLERLVREENVDIVFFHGTNAIPFYAYRLPNYIVLHSCKYANLVERWHGLKKSAHHFLYKFIYSGQRLLCVSNSAKRDMLEQMRASPLSIDTIYNGFDFKRIQKDANAPVSIELPEKFIMAAGRPDRTKRFDVLIKAYANCKAKQNYDLVIFGDGKALPKLRSMAKQFGLSEKIHFMGFLSPLTPIFRHASLYVLSSDVEGLPTVVVESIALGVPVVATDAGGAEELLANGLQDFICARGDIEALSRSIDRALIAYPNPNSDMLSFLRKEQVAEAYVGFALQRIGEQKYD